MCDSLIDPLDDVMVSLRCYEPAGMTVELTGNDVVNHTLAFGGSGAGKTTRLVNPMVEQLVAYQSGERRLKTGFCVLDSKGDGAAAEFLKDVCCRTERSEDLVIVDGDNGNFIDPLSWLRTDGIEGADAIASVLASSIPRDDKNHYWQQTFAALLRQAVRLYFLSSDSVSFRDFGELLIRYLLDFRLHDEVVKNRVEFVRDRMQCGQNDASAVGHEVVAMHRMWETLESRTRSILQSMTASVLGPLNAPAASRYFTGNSACCVEECVREGKIILFSVDAIRNPEVARLIAVFLKGHFYDSVLRRRISPKGPNRLAGLVLDDWALSATGGTGSRFSDVDALSLIRSRRGFLIAACQGIAGMDLAMGATSRRAALANFGNVFLFRSRDLELDSVAAAWFGETKEVFQDRSYAYSRANENPPLTEIRFEREVRRPAVPPGSLARLPVGETYALVGGQPYPRPLSLVPSFCRDMPF